MTDAEKESSDHERRIAELEEFKAKMERLEVTINGSNGAVEFTKQNAVIRIGVQT